LLADFISIRGLHVKLWAPKVVGVSTLAISGFLGVLRQNVIWMWASWRGTKYTISGKVVTSPDPGRGEFCEFELPVARPSTKSAPTMH
jgi:hypothetical protein